MRAYYYDNRDGDPTLPHDSGRQVEPSVLKSMGVLHWSIPVDQEDKWQEEIDQVAREREYKNRDVIESSRSTLGENYSNAMATVWKEHMHDDEEIRYALRGGAYFDVRELPTDTWIRVHVHGGDLLVLPAGIYHRFSLDDGESVKMMRLFKDEPKWIAHYRGPETDTNPRRKEYLATFAGPEAIFVA
ncbi:acireductone dioxygenase [Phanerochaete sordida]|uniref:Acireductone dioxygenase n=1 Tax=Phanerochaete sordida TaxID=48140 RepID=A0A9P3LI94_9APHY|nr:acireductone dioxygenase [Phanerochaete sordida]